MVMLLTFMYALLIQMFIAKQLYFIWFGFALNNLYGFSFTPSIFHPFVHSFMLNERWARTHMSDASEQEVFRFH